ncbi:Uncharacterised protein [Slackia heliotrinireducens]|uniref:Uncharacterized protein n=1 Tax=Slackia heliotrinireducens (strain ATCC 29202 / DSM 20476 / NCTC 11029 / RHS 1) TaxID=471855 RepID=C7N5V1_SLAHD|nr:hypothetical protein [Slackia heliotrinireducens]ACV22286.1 hypothetical protein Shel_12590 [Slackia heliotrinireducens DSM 20476]VEH00476.1 Uncharacterised protein [Slackia heliotrinireducens]
MMRWSEDGWPLESDGFPDGEHYRILILDKEHVDFLAMLTPLSFDEILQLPKPQQEGFYLEELMRVLVDGTYEEQVLANDFMDMVVTWEPGETVSLVY